MLEAGTCECWLENDAAVADGEGDTLLALLLVLLLCNHPRFVVNLAENSPYHSPVIPGKSCLESSNNCIFFTFMTDKKLENWKFETKNTGTKFEAL